MKAIFDYLYDLFDARGRREAHERTQERAHAERMALIAAENASNLAAIAAQRLEVEQKLELAKKATHEQTLELVEAVLSRVQTIATANNEGLMEVAKGIQENGKALNTWMQLFKDNQGPGETHTIRPADEYEAELKREEGRLRELGYIVDDPAVTGEEVVNLGVKVANMFSAADRG